MVNYFFHCRSQLLLPLHLVIYFHYSWWTISSIADVNYFFPCSWSTYSSIAAGRRLLPLQKWSTTSSIADVNYFLLCSWPTTPVSGGHLLPFQLAIFFYCTLSNTSSIPADQIFLSFQLVKYFSIGAGQILLLLHLVNNFFHYSWSATSSIATGQLHLPLQQSTTSSISSLTSCNGRSSSPVAIQEVFDQL